MFPKVAVHPLLANHYVDSGPLLYVGSPHMKVHGCVEINQCVGCTFLGDDAAVPAPSGGEEPAPSRYRAGAASMASRSMRRFSMDAVTFRFPCRRAASSGGGRASSRDAASGAGGRAGARRLYLQRRSRNTTESGRRAVYLARTRSGASTRPTPDLLNIKYYISSCASRALRLWNRARRRRT